MTIPFVRAIRAPLLLAALPALFLTSCAGDEVTSPIFGTGCTAGALKPGDDITGAFNEESCLVPLYWWAGNRVPYTTYRVTLQEGTGYRFYLGQIPDDEFLDEVDAVLVLWGRNATGASEPFAASDDDGEGTQGLNSELIFIAAKSGTFNLVASSYDFSLLGGYRITMEECPVVVLDTAGTYANLAFPTTDCVRHSFAGTANDSKVALLAVPADALETVDLTVTAAGFATAAEIGGPGWDVYQNVRTDTDFSVSPNDPAIVNETNSSTDGVYTMMVGASTGTPTGPFTVVLERTPGIALRAGLVQAGGSTLKARGGLEGKKKPQR